MEDKVVLQDQVSGELKPEQSVILRIYVDYDDKVLLGGVPFSRIEKEMPHFLEQFKQGKEKKIVITIEKENSLGRY